MREVLALPWIRERTRVVFVGTGSLAAAKLKAEEVGLFSDGANPDVLFVTDESGKVHRAFGCHRGVVRTLTLRRWENWVGLFRFVPEVMRFGIPARRGAKNNAGDPWMQAGTVVVDGAGNEVYANLEVSPGHPRPDWDAAKEAMASLPALNHAVMAAASSSKL